MCICLVFALILTGCGTKEDEKTGKISLVVASFDEDIDLENQIRLYNRTHYDYEIEFRKYERTEQKTGDGIAKLQREIISGEGPDIINYGKDYSVTDVLGEYTEDLLPYIRKIESDNNSYFINILNAFTYQNKLYAMPVSFSLKTYAVKKTIVEDKKSWTIGEMMMYYQNEYSNLQGSFMLYPGATKKDVFGSMIKCSIGSFVDWENGTCNFEGEDFKKLLEFANQFPDNLRITEEFSPMQSFANGDALLYPVSLNSVYDISKTEAIMGQNITYIGYPTNGLSGTVIEPGSLMLAISADSEHKKAAWEFINQFIEVEYQNKISAGYPICKNALDNQLTDGRNEEYVIDADGNRTLVAKSSVIFEGETPINIYGITEEQENCLLQIIDDASVSSAYDSTVHSILLEEAEQYFSGQKDLEETSEIMQNRISIYMEEHM